MKEFGLRLDVRLPPRGGSGRVSRASRNGSAAMAKNKAISLSAGDAATLRPPA